MKYAPKRCKECGKEFIPNSGKQNYCKDIHYRPCPICGKPVEVKHFSDKSRTCSTECMLKLKDKTCLHRYGTTDAANSTLAKEKRRQTNLKKYGVENPFQSEAIKAKSKETLKEKYGVEYISQSADIKQKVTKTWNSKSNEELNRIKESRKQSCIEKYGVENPIQSEEIQQKIKATNLKKYGVEYHIVSPEIRSKSANTLAKNTCKIPNSVLDYFNNVPKYDNTKFFSETILNKPISDNNIFEVLSQYISNVVRNYKLGGCIYDIYLPDLKIVVRRVHTYTDVIFSNRESYLIARNYGLRCIHVFDWDDWSKIVSIILPKHTIYARDCKIIYLDADGSNSFFYKYHVQGCISNQLVGLGLMYRDKLIQVMTFGIPRYNHKYQWELLRFATISSIQVIGGASKLFKHFIDIANPTSIISYCNLSKFSGNVYNKLGFRYIRTNSSTAWWYNDDIHKVISNTLLLQRGFDQLFGTNFGKGTSNEELMMKHHWRPVYDCGQAVYEWLPVNR